MLAARPAHNLAPGDISNIKTIAAIFAAMVICCALSTPARAQPPAAPVEMLADAELTDIRFVDPDRGIAVGERGAIWRTDNGGQHWRLIPSPIVCRLESVHFIDDRRGWIVGGYPLPLTHQSVGVILRTSDGGRTWTQLPPQSFPWLKQVRFFDSKHGWAAGHVSDACPAGMVRTTDGGETWVPVSGVAPAGWHAGAFGEPDRGVLVGQEGNVAVSVGSSLKPARMPGIGARPVRRVELLGAGDSLGWLAGDGGLVLCTENGGIDWTLPRGEIPAIARQMIDFRALALRGAHVWMAGAPGSVVLHSGDGGTTWELFRTEQTTPLRALFFLDQFRGWGVGALGTILATRDGGRTWTVQRRGGARAALLAVSSEPARLPWELIAKVAGNEGYLTAAEVLAHVERPVSSPLETPLLERTQTALARIGGSHADGSWQFPLRDPQLGLANESILALWDRVHDGRGVATLEAHIVSKIRQWRPDVIVTEQSAAQGGDPLAQLINQLVLGAASKAADASAYPEQISLLGLGTWHARKVVSALPAETPGGIQLSTAQLAPRLGASLADAVTPSRNLVLEEFRPAVESASFQVLVNSLPQDVGTRDIFSGIHLPAGSEARRMLSETSPAVLESLRRAAQRTRNIQHIMARSAGDPESGGSWLGQVDDLTKGQARSGAGNTLYELAWRYHHSGQWESAADAFAILAERYPDHELAGVAATWLVQYYASGEIGLRLRNQTRAVSGQGAFPVRPAMAEGTLSPGQAPLANVDPRNPHAELSLRTNLTTATGALNPLARAHKAQEIGKKLAQTSPALVAEPALRLALASAQRQTSLSRHAEGTYRSITQQRRQDSFWNMAAAEQWLLQPTARAPQFMHYCQRTTEKPHLDGQLDEALWQAAKPLELRSASDERQPPASVLMTQDGEFMYIAVVCPWLAGKTFPPAVGRRTRDADLAAYDRVELQLDLDRDYATYYSLSVDCRGFASDSLWGDASWNPTWHVAAAHNEREWIVEAAIPLGELTNQPLRGRDTWALGVQRVVPGVGRQSWTQPCELGLLVFE